MADITPMKRSCIVSLLFRNTENIPKQPLQTAKRMQRRRGLICRKIWCMLEFT